MVTESRRRRVCLDVSDETNNVGPNADQSAGQSAGQNANQNANPAGGETGSQGCGQGRGTPTGSGTLASPDVPMTCDELVTRLLDGRASPADWRALRDSALSDPQMWIELIDISELGDGLGQVVKAAQQRATAVDVPGAVVQPRLTAAAMVHGASSRERADGEREHHHAQSVPSFAGAAGFGATGGDGGRGRLRRADRLGWLVAVLLAVGLVTMAVKPGSVQGLLGPGRGGSAASLAPLGLASPDEAMRKYLELGKAQGRVVGELPQRIILESRELPGGGGREVLYIRQLIERAVVDDLYRFGTDDQGRPVVLPGRSEGGAPSGL